MENIKSRTINSDIDDVEDVLKKVEISYQIKFQPNEMAHLKTFGEITNHIISKIEMEDLNNCTSQQAFYKLRKAIVETIGISDKEIMLETNLESLFPRKNRRKQIALIEQNLGFQLKALKVSNNTVKTSLVLLLISFITIFFNWKYGLCGILATIILMKISDKMANEFDDKTIGDLAMSMMQDNYVLSRRNSKSVNKSEIKKNIERMFINELGLSGEFDELTDDTIIIDE